MIKKQINRLHANDNGEDMTYVVTDACINCKYQDCIEVCPIDCFYEGENMIVIDTEECIDCGVCEPECPIDAIIPDTDPEAEKWIAINQKYAKQWPNIAEKRTPPYKLSLLSEEPAVA